MNGIKVTTDTTLVIQGDRVVIDGVEHVITKAPKHHVDGSVSFETDKNPGGFYFHPSKTPTLVVLL